MRPAYRNFWRHVHLAWVQTFCDHHGNVCTRAVQVQQFGLSGSGRGMERKKANPGESVLSSSRGRSCWEPAPTMQGASLLGRGLSRWLAPWFTAASPLNWLGSSRTLSGSNSVASGKLLQVEHPDLNRWSHKCSWIHTLLTPVWHHKWEPMYQETLFCEQNYLKYWIKLSPDNFSWR